MEHLAGFSVVSRCIGGRLGASWKRVEGILEALRRLGGVTKKQKDASDGVSTTPAR